MTDNNPRVISAKNVRVAIADITLARTRGQLYADARSALIAYGVIILGIPQTDVVSQTGVDKGDVSRVCKLARELPDTLAALEAFDDSLTQNKRIEAAAAIGVALRRVRKPSKSADKSGDTPTGDTPTGDTPTGDKPAALTQTAADRIEAARELIYALYLELTDADADRLDIAVTEAKRAARIDRKRAMSGKAPHGMAA